MFNLQQRLNVVASFAMTSLGCVLAVIAAISAFTSYGMPTGALKVDPNTFRVVTRRYGPDHYDYRNSKSEFARLAFDLDADFTPLFNWNTKQIFVSVVAEYESKTHNRNKIVLWDRIITDRNNANLQLRNIPNKYALIDVSRKWSQQQANLSLHWDITPHVGLLQSGQSPEALANIVLSPAPQK
ncbi:signal peptidase 22kDa subunit [Halteromyces radiatus]|uniref:signal peptidase 22kDa subunit n=1 Tax=Halteromyces radiatus TaxID=101107 RepID=UPI00221E7FD3|nr:signal peptidase 22kDa subunit [Halteromyces radiatus]KAI8092663.1 signal peptidase 22kDa subunit [Halteromyces radiatus]